MGHLTRLVDSPPARFLSRRCFGPHAQSVLGECVRIEPTGSYSHSVLCPIMRQPRVRACHRRTCSRVSLDQCLFYRTMPREIFFINMEIVGVIPARFASTRLPGKALLSETGRPLILHVIEAARRSQSLQRIIVATDDERIAQAVTGFGGEVMMTRTDHATGTDRVAEVAARLERARIIVNLQGDEPEISGDALDLVVALLENDHEAPMATLATPIRDESIYRDPACVKVVLQPARAGTLLLAQPDPLPSRRPSRARHGRAAGCLPCTLASTRTAAISCSISARFPLHRWRPPRSSSSSACSKRAIRSPSASSTSPASASTRPKIIAGSSRGGGSARPIPVEVRFNSQAERTRQKILLAGPVSSVV